MEGISDRIVDLHSDVVDGWLRIFMELLVNANGVFKFEWWQWVHERSNCIWDVGNISFVSVEELLC